MIVGAAGQDGQYLSGLLEQLKIEWIGISRSGNFLNIDLSNFDELKEVVRRHQPDYIFHLAAQSLVRRSYADPVETFTTNAVGTMNLLEAARNGRHRCPVIVVTSDKCYENRGSDRACREEDPLGGHDVYSMSKAATELPALLSLLLQISPGKAPKP